MAGITGTLTDAVVARLVSTVDGVNVRIGAIEAADPTLTAAGIRTVAALNASVEISEKAGYAHYPALLVYYDKLSNRMMKSRSGCVTAGNSELSKLAG